MPFSDAICPPVLTPSMHESSAGQIARHDEPARSACLVPSGHLIFGLGNALFFGREALWIDAAVDPGVWSADLLYLFDDCVLDSDRRELRRGRTSVALEPQVFDLLEY